MKWSKRLRSIGGPAARPRLAPEREWQLIRLAENRL
jgi:hypothetical protein